MYYFYIIFFLSINSLYLFSQPHWETIVSAGDEWRYIIPNAATPANWKNPSFDDSSWLVGYGGIGYGDGDDQTLAPEGTISIYMRRQFELYDTAVLIQALLNIDYDDGFVAYLNGIEIARANIDGYPPIYDGLAYDHEAETYQGGDFPYFFVETALWQSLATVGSNVLAIEIHNASSESSDLSAIPFLSVETTTAGITYQTPPIWFDAPISNIPTYNLPIIHINTNGQYIMDEPRITAQMGIIWNGEGNTQLPSDAPNHYNGDISVEYRGNSSQFFPKRSMGLTTIDEAGNDHDVSLLGMPAEHDWILYAPYTDKAMMRDALSYELARQMSWYATRTRYVELFVNQEYQGIFILMEKLKRDANRIDISRLKPDDNSGDPLTGGYILKTDHFAGNVGEPFYSSNGVTVQYEYPRFDAISDPQKAYIQNYINDFEAALYSELFDDPQTGYRAYVNIYSFIDLILLNELSNNVDGYRLSAYYYKDRDSQCGRLTFSPPWDFNLTYGNADYCEGWRTDVWQLYDGCADGPAIWFRRMLEDPYFAAVLRCRWSELRQYTLQNSHINQIIDSTAFLLKQAAVRDSAQWQTIGNYIWPNYYISNSYQGEVDTLKWWIKQRLQWIDDHIFGMGVSCGSLAPQTVRINEINYHSANIDTLDSGDWIELYNYGDSSVDISNWLLTDQHDLRRYCQIPPNTVLPPNGYWLLCSDTARFANLHPTLSALASPLCFNLDNGGTRLALYNAQHQRAFDLIYSDQAPFDTLPDGHGYTLELTHFTANTPAVWSASCGLKGTPAAPPAAQLSIDLTTDNPISCKNGIAQYHATARPNAIYTWTITAGNGIIVSGQGTPNISILWVGTGMGEVSVSVIVP